MCCGSPLKEELNHLEAGEMARWLGAPAALPGDLAWLPSTYMVAPQPSVSLVPWDPILSPGLRGYQACPWFTDRHTGKPCVLASVDFAKSVLFHSV